MNKTYRLLFNKSLGVMQVVSELAKSSTKGASKSTDIALEAPSTFKKHLIAVALVSFCGAISIPALAGPLDGGAGAPNTNGGVGAGGGGNGGISYSSGGSGGGGGVTNGGSGGSSAGVAYLGGGGGSGAAVGVVSNQANGINGADAPFGDAGGGGGGAAMLFITGSFVNTQNLNGGNGGAGGIAYYNGGSGGGGGVGVYAQGAGSSLTNNSGSTITGGRGGNGGFSTGFFGGAGGYGGFGGAGVSGTSFSLNNAGTISGGRGGNGGDGIYNGAWGGGGGAGVIGTGFSLNNTGTISGGRGGNGGGGTYYSGGSYGAGDGVFVTGGSTNITNAGSITGGQGGAGGAGGGSAGYGGAGIKVAGSGTTTITNSGSITGGSGGSGMINASPLYGMGGDGIEFQATGGTTTITNASTGIIAGGNGTIDSNQNRASAGNGIWIAPNSTLTTLTNMGSIIPGSLGALAYGINNAGGSLTTLNNAQGVGNTNGALTYFGALPTNYNIIIDSASNYGQFSVASASGSMTFGIYTGSTVSAGTYMDVLQGFTSLSGISGTSGSYNSFTYSLVRDGSTNDWNLVFSGGSSGSDMTGVGTIYQSSNLGTSVNPVFDGGTLQITSGSQAISNAFTVTSNNGVIDQNGLVSTFSGVISDAVSGTPGSMTITNSGNGGSVIFTGINTYTGSTTINSGATLALNGSGSIATSSGVTNNGTFDISNTGNGATVQAITGAGATNLGFQALTISNAAGNLSGVVSGNGGSLNITGGTQILSGNNTFSGGVQVQSGAALTIPDGSALGTGTLALVGSSSVPATLNVTGTTTIANTITVAGDPVFNIASGTTTTISSPIVNGSVAGDVVVTGGGTLDLAAANTYTGLTTIGLGSTLALTGAGSIANSTSVTNNGTFNVSGKSGNISLGGSFTQNSTGNLVMGFSPSANQKIIVGGTAALAGSLNLVASGGTYSAGRYSILTANGVTGTFSNLTSNLGSYTNLAYLLSYEANDVYLNFFSNGPSTADTQQSLINTASALQSIYTLQNTVLANSFSYDCNVFGANNVCISAGGRNTAVSAANGLNNTSGLLIAAYRPAPNYRVGAYADQNLSVNNAGSTVNLGNNTPLIGLFGAWNERLDGTGAEVKVSAAYGQKNTTVTRQVVGTSEAGSGSSQLNSQGAQVTAKYGFGVVENVIVSPYAGIRYTQNNMGGYTEGASASVTAPLTYSALNTNATTALAGVGASYRFIPQATAFASAGVETDTNTANGTYSATGVTGLTPVNFNANPVKTRPTAMIGAAYSIEKNQRIGVTGIYRQEPYQGVSSATVMATYTIGL